MCVEKFLLVWSFGRVLVTEMVGRMVCRRENAGKSNGFLSMNAGFHSTLNGVEKKIKICQNQRNFFEAKLRLTVVHIIQLLLDLNSKYGILR